MTFLSSGALFGLALLAIPIVVHLFKPRHVRQTPFSSLRWLHLSQQRMARRIQWHQVLLFLLRVGFLTLLVLALSRPIWSPTGTASGLDRIVVLDISRSMGRRVEGRPTPWETARDVASQLIRRTLPGDLTAVLLTGSTTEVLAPWTNAAMLYLPSLSSLQTGLAETQLDSAFEPIRSLLAQRRPGVQVEIVFLTDNPANGWNTSEVSAFAQEIAGQAEVSGSQSGSRARESSDRSLTTSATGEISLRLIDVGLPAPRNAWLNAARLRTRNSETVLHVEASCTSDGVMQRTLRVSGLSGVKQQDFPLALQPGKRTALDIPLPSTFDRKGSRVTLRLEPSDELPDDDVYYYDLDITGDSRLLLITPNRVGWDSVPTIAIGSTPTRSGQSPNLHPGLALETAIRSLAENGSVAADGQLVIRTPITVSAAEIASADVILLADVPGLSEGLSTAITERVRRGAGLAMFLGPNVDSEVYNRAFVQPLVPAHSLLPGELSGSVQADAKQGGLSSWKQWNDRHPLLTGLVDPEVGDLAGTESRAWYRFGSPMTTADEVLATLEDGTPALIARRVEAGRVVVINGSADDRWCDLPRRKSFVPLVDRLLLHLQSAGIRRQFTSGETMTVALPESFSNPTRERGRRVQSAPIPTDSESREAPALADASGYLSPRVISPTGRTLSATVHTVSNRTWLTTSETTESGFYHIQPHDGSEADLILVVQPGRGDSRLEPFDPEKFHAWWSPAEMKIEQPTASTANAPLSARAGYTPATSVDRRLVLEPWLIILACLCFLAEMFLAHWMCPRMNPALSTSHHRRRGFVAPLREREGVAP
jgi:aerotolerance regulator-like protein/VWA domain-containing protein